MTVVFRLFSSLFARNEIFLSLEILLFCCFADVDNGEKHSQQVEEKDASCEEKEERGEGTGATEEDCGSVKTRWHQHDSGRYHE